VLPVAQTCSEEGWQAPIALLYSSHLQAKKCPTSRRPDLCFVTAAVDLRQFQNIQSTLDNTKEGLYHSRTTHFNTSEYEVLGRNAKPNVKPPSTSMGTVSAKHIF